MSRERVLIYTHKMDKHERARLGYKTRMQASDPLSCFYVSVLCVSAANRKPTVVQGESQE